MNRITIVVMAGLLAPGLALAQSSANVQAGASAQSQTDATVQGSRSGEQVSGNSSTSAQTNASANAGKDTASLADGTNMSAALKGSLDAKKSKVGDRVEAETTQDVKQDGKVVLRKGTRLVGHVTEVQAREKSQETSRVGVMFEEADMRDGRQIPMHASIQALAATRSAAQASTSAGEDDLFAGGGGGASASAAGGGAVRGGGLAGGALRTTSSTVGGVGTGVGNTASGVANGTVHTATRSTDAVGGLNANGVLTSDSRGVFGLDGMSLDAAGSSTTQGSLIVSNTRNVHLDSGTQMVLQVAGEAR